MRVIAGEFKGRKLLSPKGRGVRPTTDLVKEAIFSMIAPYLPDAVCLDLFAGTGALGIEALSRGAARVYFCDVSPDSTALLRQNLDACRVDGRGAVVYRSDWRGAVTKLGEKCNLVFIDAPYEMWEYYSQILETLAAVRVLGTDARIVVERDADMGGYALPVNFERVREKRYGGIGVDLLAYADRGEEA
ncbi:MAG: 16S rRNA (guanine(966)-N(2))-methyltransferase RsmD [Clostridiales Family XIII bacterium]|jgi:16S rRNA (guanine(966)-N(2))-methyltransferase RsmD|nr:16S rRNA (guanine(966)-N(2))-methyltransferase RsmD [Clostridiales Family XIII bacterium]